MKTDAYQKITELLGSNLDFSTPDTSFSPMFSNIGLCIENKGGIGGIFLHYNRITVKFYSPLIQIPGELITCKKSAFEVHQVFNHGEAKIAFYDRNSWLLDYQGSEAFTLNLASVENLHHKKVEIEDKRVFLKGSHETTDDRDPDKYFPLIFGLKVLQGTLEDNNGVVSFIPNEQGRLVVSSAIEILEIDKLQIIDQLDKASDIESAKICSQNWLNECLGDGVTINGKNNYEEGIQARAVYTLLSNCTEAPGILKGRVSAFPSRGEYPVHYLWDSVFQNLALDKMKDTLAEDSLLILTENLRVDGKMAMFYCSTWLRPFESQPPLVGWSALNLVQKRNDLVFAGKVLEPLIMNTKWWLTQRRSDTGLIMAEHGLETGWDDSPRFDSGPTVSCDMNSYLLMQIRAISELAKLLNKDEIAHEYKQKADEYAQLMVDKLYDESTGLFWDICVESGEWIKLKTPACFLPFLAGVPVPQEKQKQAIQEVLLNPDFFYGDVPFPSVAYDEEKYDHKQWWRGPTWMPIAFFMIELLEKTGFSKEANDSKENLYNMMLKDGNLRELFDSKTGEGLGAYEQGWTAAIFLHLAWTR